MNYLKQLVAEIIGDGQLFEEGRQDMRRDGPTPPEKRGQFTSEPKARYETSQSLANPSQGED
jgi:hypothetical protein